MTTMIAGTTHSCRRGPPLEQPKEDYYQRPGAPYDLAGRHEAGLIEHKQRSERDQHDSC